MPGFFGFTSLGAVSYFRDVERVLALGLERRGIAARIVRCPTQPTGSIPRRAERLRRHVVAQGGLEASELHFIGHSTGGLDLRLLLTPGVRISSGDSEERIASRTLSAITVTTPHYGTPLANFFTTTQGQSLLLLLSSLAISGQGRGAIYAAAQATSLIARLDDWLGRTESTLDQAAKNLLRGLTFSRRDPVWKYLESIASDQGAVLQLTPEASDLFNAAVTDRSGIDYGCVVAGLATPGPSLRSVLGPRRLALRALFRLLHGVTARPHPRYPYPQPTRATRRLLQRGLGFAATPRTNDGIVPTLSQLHGRVLHVARADHLDVVGHYTLAPADAGDWLPSGAGFTAAAFSSTWDKVATAIAQAARRTARRPGR